MSHDQQNSAEVRLRNRRIGILSRSFSHENTTQYSFKYDQEYLSQPHSIPISLQFPLREAPFLSNTLHPFFDNLILEGWLLQQAEKTLKIDKKNRWALLMHTGANPIGAVSIHPLNDSSSSIRGNSTDHYLTRPHLKDYPITIPSLLGNCSFCFKPITKSQSYHLSCYRKLFGTTKSLSLTLDEQYPLQSFSELIHDGSISGAQRKGLFTLSKNKLRPSATHSQYILKPDGDFPELPANEHLTMTVAKNLGFDVPPTGLIKIDQLGLIYIIKRFDISQNGQKLLIEDMAQIYNEASDNKYSLSHEKIAQAILQHTQAGRFYLYQYFKRILFCYLTSNGDMHLKNWALLEMENQLGTYRLSPVYDWLNTKIALRNERDEIALPILGKKRNLKKSHFKRFALDELKLSTKQLEKIWTELPRWVNCLQNAIPLSFLSKDMKAAYLSTLKQKAAVLLEDSR